MTAIIIEGIIRGLLSAAASVVEATKRDDPKTWAELRGRIRASIADIDDLVSDAEQDLSEWRSGQG